MLQKGWNEKNYLSMASLKVSPTTFHVPTKISTMFGAKIELEAESPTGYDHTPLIDHKKERRMQGTFGHEFSCSCS